ncbi:MAG: hypothetical protein J6V38_02870 [Kiritimatiellae bacterium]|nr:hypothetical protein [Kiritimatiellia bacterium]
MRAYTADFETTTNPDDCRVWAWGLFEIGSYGNYEYGNSIDGFITRLHELAKTEKPTVYFHNLKFDAQFIIYWLFANGFSWVRDKSERGKCTFMTLISSMGQFYAIDIYFGKRSRSWQRVRILDSFKILPIAVSEMPEAFGLELKKLEIDYDDDRPIGHELTDQESAYLRNDCEIVARSLKHMFDMGLTKMTLAGDALASYKEIVGKRAFERWFPEPEYDADVRQSYRGGFVYVNPKYAGKEIGRGIVLDVNSLYPWAYATQPLPYGEPKFFNGRYQPDSLYTLYVQMFRCSFRVKPGHIPTVQLKGSRGFIPTEYVTDSGGEEVCLCLTSVDLELFLDHYDVFNVEWFSGWKWKASTCLFTDYTNKWFELKAQATRDGNAPLRFIAKRMLNSIYGRFAINPQTYSKEPVFDIASDSVRYINGPDETRKALYIPVGTFVTAHARNKTIRAAQAVYDRFLYGDTDSLHLIGTELPPELDIDDVKLGAWAHEATFDRAKFIRAKTYVEEIDGKLKVTCAGMPAQLHKLVTFDNFKPGAVYGGKLLPKIVTGGVVLAPTTFKIQGG